MSELKVPENSIRHHMIDVVEFYCPEWYRREDFVDMLNKSARGEMTLPLTWHKAGEPDEWSDVFTFYDAGEGPDCDLFPEDIWDAICAVCEERRINYALIKIMNLEGYE